MLKLSVILSFTALASAVVIPTADDSPQVSLTSWPDQAQSSMAITTYIRSITSECNPSSTLSPLVPSPDVHSWIPFGTVVPTSVLASSSSTWLPTETLIAGPAFKTSRLSEHTSAPADATDTPHGASRSQHHSHTRRPTHTPSGAFGSVSSWGMNSSSLVASPTGGFRRSRPHNILPMSTGGMAASSTIPTLTVGGSGIAAASCTPQHFACSDDSGCSNGNVCQKAPNQPVGNCKCPLSSSVPAPACSTPIGLPRCPPPIGNILIPSGYYRIVVDEVVLQGESLLEWSICDSNDNLVAWPMAASGIISSNRCLFPWDMEIIPLSDGTRAEENFRFQLKGEDSGVFIDTGSNAGGAGQHMGMGNAATCKGVDSWREIHDRSDISAQRNFECIFSPKTDS